MATFEQYSPSDVIVTVNNRPVAGWEEITVEMDDEENTVHKGIHGDARFVRNLSKTGTVSLTLLAYSPSNIDILQAHKLGVPFSIAVVDRSTKGTAFATGSAKLVKVPALSRSREGGNVEYQFAFLAGEISHGSATLL